jgi:hypothetical protein
MPLKVVGAQVLLTHQPANGRPKQVADILTADQDGQQPLDIALITRQWPAVRFLIAAGALQACPELAKAERLLQRHMASVNKDQFKALRLLVRPTPGPHVFNGDMAAATKGACSPCLAM